MKKEILSVCLLTALIAASFVNIRGVRKLTEEMTAYIEDSVKAVYSEDWNGAERYAQLAKKLWNEKDVYTHMVLRHSEIDTVSDALYDYISDVQEQSAEASYAGAEKVIYHLDSIYQMERVRFGSIF